MADYYMFEIDDVIDEFVFFTECIKFYVLIESPVEVDIWGKVHIELKNELEKFRSKVSILRRLIFRQNTYKVTFENVDKFLSIIGRMEIERHAWGLILRVGENILKGEEDISINCDDKVICDKISDLLSKLKSENIIKGYELTIDDYVDPYYAAKKE